jgi:hypothetical protein
VSSFRSLRRADTQQAKLLAAELKAIGFTNPEFGPDAAVIASGYSCRRDAVRMGKVTFKI